MSVTRVFAPCNGGHYFVGRTCPFDGWQSEETESIARAGEHFASEGQVPSVAALEGAGLTAKAMARACVMEFYSDDHTFDAIEPNLVSVAGRAYRLADAPSGLK